MELQGRVHKYGNNVDTDVIIPARHLLTSDPEILAKYCMEDIDPDFAGKVTKGDIIVAGNNFGCGSSREHAPIAIKGSGVSIVIAKSFARIFFRNSINIGLPIMECPQAIDEISAQDVLKVDMDKGELFNVTTGKRYNGTPFPYFMQAIINAGGLMDYIKNGGLNNV